MTRYFFILCAFLIILLSPKTGFSNEDNDSTCIQNFPHKITLKTYFSSTDLFYTTRDFNAKYKPVIYRPNSNNSIGFSASYKSIGISYSFRIKETPEKEHKYGQTKYSNFRLNYFYKKFGFDGYLLNYKGLYLDNPRSFYTLSPRDYFPRQSNMQLTAVGYNFIYTKNECFSFRSVYFQSVRQKKSIGSIVFMFANRFFRYKNDSTYIPQPAQRYMPEFSKSDKGSIWDMTIAPGYAYTWVKEKFFFSGSLFAGVGEQVQMYTKQSLTYFRYKPTTKFNFKAAIGYNEDNYFGKISYDMDLHTMRIEDSRQNTMLNGFDFIIGIRIK